MSEHESVEEEAVRRRAHEISLGPDSGTPEENWLRAEAELRQPAADEDAVRREEEEAARDAASGEVLQAHLSSPTHP